VSTVIKRTVSLYFHSVDPQANVSPGIPEDAICVQVIAAQYILQFAIVIALCCALHRSASRVIHRSECYFNFNLYNCLHMKLCSFENIGRSKPVIAYYSLSHKRSLRPIRPSVSKHLRVISLHTQSKRAPHD
jgi:hypothetical protein